MFQKQLQTMDNSKRITVNHSSLLGLRAELLKKQAEVKAAKEAAQNDQQTLPKVKRKVKDKKSSKKIPKQLIDTDDVKAHKKSQLMLEAKTRLYDKLTKGIVKDDKFLVNFEDKDRESSEEEVIDKSPQEEYVSDEEGWVEYKDCFGRTRKCLRQDLPTMIRKDDKVKVRI